MYSPDSITVAYEAARNTFGDMHAVLLPFAVSLLLKATGNFSLIIVFQLLTGTFGVRALVRSIAQSSSLRQSQVEKVTLLILLILFSPLTLFPIMLVVLWNDTWLSIFMVWILALLMNLYQGTELSRGFYVRLITLILVIVLAMAARQNAVVVYPAVALALMVVLYLRSIPLRYRLIVSLIPAITYITYVGFQDLILNVQHANPERAVYALDLASMIRYDPSVCNNLAISSCDLIWDTFPSDFNVGHGAIDLTLNQGEASHEFFIELFYYPALKKEFISVAIDHPQLLFTVNMLNYLDYLQPNPGRYFYPKVIPSNNLGLTPEKNFARERKTWFFTTDWFLNNKVFTWFSFVHGVWLVVGILELLICFILGSYVNRERYMFLACLLLIPLSYYASYFFALTSSEFRFMYPSTLVVQVITLTLLFAAISRWLPRGTSRLRRLLARPAGLHDPS